jgi:hypothetical protein
LLDLVRVRIIRIVSIVKLLFFKCGIVIFQQSCSICIVFFRMYCLHHLN